jgi:sigma-B regulation protein RsbU (phosphoserine phosphatase)
MFATAIYGVLDVQRRTWRSTCAGHPPPLLVRAGQPAAPLPSERTQMLLFSDLEAVGCNEQELHPGDRIVLYTDGITDRQAADGTLFEEDGLISALDRVAAFAPASIVERLMIDLEAFAGGLEAEDDQTVLVIGMARDAWDVSLKNS